MKKFKNLLISFLVAACAVCIGVAFAACSNKGDKSGSKYGYGEEGVYYYSADSETDYLMTLQSGTYMISLNGVSGYSGTYSYDAEAGTVSFTSNDGETFEASFADDAMQLAISGQPYTFLRSVNETVTFMDGNSVVDTRTVTYGKSAEAIDGEKSGYIFIGWYEDAAFTTPYKFNTAVTGDVTLYAYYIEEDSTISNFDITYISDGKVVGTAKTQNGMALEREMPEVEGILGWWVSDTNNEDELTYKYDGQILKEATNLYAVKDTALGASVYGDRITWEAQVSSVTITVDGKVVTSSASGNAYSYDMSALGTGEHTVEVSASGYGTENLVYVVNKLARVSNFAVYGTTLVYNRVENAEYYRITVTCANPSHSHEMVYNGNTLTYDFSNCEMGPDGITFTVYAYGTGYLESVSETFVYRLVLDGTEVSVDAATDTASWAPVENATGYEVYVNGDLVATLTATEYSLKNYGMGTVSVSVKPVAPGYWSEASEAVSYTKATLPAPEITGIDTYTVSWSAVEGATNYVIYVNGKQIETVSADITSYALAGDADFVRADSYVITVKATNSSNTNQNSQESDPVYATDATMSPLLVYEDGVVYWQYAMAVGTYYVTVNDGDETAVEGKNSFDVTFTQSGENVIKVYFNGSAVASLSVTTYAVIFDTRGGNSIDTIYVAKGDTIKLEEPVFESGDANFIGWYTLPDLVGDYDADMYLGDGYLVSDGTVFTGDGTLILYASWLSVKYLARLDAGMGVVYDDEGLVVESTLIAKNSSTFALPVPMSDDVTYIFYGWYSGENGTGTRYTDADGNAIRTYNMDAETTLYAYWRQVVAFTLTTYQFDYVLSALAGEAIDEVTEVTVPGTYIYGGVEYTVAMLGADAFKNCSKLETINLPDTIQYITITNNGYSSGNGSFAGCDSLKNVNVYGTGSDPVSTKEITYYSGDGVLFRKNSITGYLELIYYPQGRANSEYTVPSTVAVYGYDMNGNYVVFELDEDGEPVVRNVEAIATQVFRGKTVSTVTIPSTVIYVETQAFYYSDVTSIIFDGDTGDSLTIDEYAFQQCKSMTEITLPGRLGEFNANIFSGCSKLANIYVSGTGSYGSIGGVLGSADGTTIYYYPLGRASGTYTIPEGVTTVGAEAFSKATNLTGLVVAKSVTTICAKAFYNCTKMTSLEFLGDSDSGDLTIETMAFYGCTGLTSVILPPNLTGLAAYSFGGCTYLTEVTYDSRQGATADSLSGLEAYAFSSSGSTSANSYVKVLNLGANVPDIEFASIFGGTQLSTVNIAEGNGNFSSVDGVVFGESGTKIMYFPVGWTGEYTVPGVVAGIGADTFSGCAGLTSITIPVSVIEIGDNAFLNCTGLTSVIFTGLTDEQVETGTEASALEMGDSVFYGCISLVEIEFPARLSCLGSGVFTGCTGLESIGVENGNTNYTAKDGILYELDDDGVTPITLLVCPENNRNKKIEIYSSITKIETSAFENNTSIVEITFSGEVDSETFVIGESAFSGCLSLETIELPEGLKTIAVSTFASCVALKKITIPESVTTIEESAFYGCSSLKEVIFSGSERTSDNYLTLVSPTSLSTSRGSTGAFYNCVSLETIELPTYTVVGDYTFRGCSSLKTMSMPVGAPGVGQYTFYECTSLESVVLGESICSVGEYAFYGCSSLTNVEGSKAVKEIGTYAFYNCSSLACFTFGEGIESLTAYAFYGTGLTELNLPASLKEITNTTFADCRDLTTITVADGSTYFGAKDSVLYGLSNGVETELWIYPKANTTTTITIPSSVTTIHQYAFTSSNVVGVVFEDYTGTGTYSLTFENISSSYIPFSGCTDLNKVVLPEGLTSLDQNLFRATSVRSVVIPSTVTSIGNYTFYACENLNEVAFTEGGEAALTFASGGSTYGTFCNCTSLTSIVLPDRTTTLGTYMFYGCSALETVTVGRNVASVPDYAFRGCSSLTSVTFRGNLVTTVGQYAFAECGAMTIALPSSVATVETYAFYESDIVSVTLDSGLTSIGANAFQNCASLGGVEIPATVTSIGDYAFSGCSGMDTLTFAVGGTSALNIGAYVFQYCSGIRGIEIAARVSAIETYAFSYCDSLSKVTFGDGSSLSAIGDYAFAYGGLKTFVFPVTSADTLQIGDQIFAGCYDIEEVFISSSVTDLGSALNNCYITKISLDSNNKLFGLDDSQPVLYGYEYGDDKIAVTRIVKAYGELVGKYEIPDTVEEIGTYAFYNQKSLTEVVIPVTVVAIDARAFEGCDLLVTVTFEEGGAESTVEFGEYVFYDCVSLENVTFAGNSEVVLGDHVFQNCTALEIIDCSAVEAFGTYTFSGCTSLCNVTLGDDLMDLGNYMFDGCTSLQYIDLPDTLVYMGTYTFQNSGLKEIVIPESVTNMGTASGSAATTSSSGRISTFEGCESLETVVLSSQIVGMGGYVFYGCSSLKVITYTGDPNYDALADYSAAGYTAFPDTFTTIGQYGFSGSGIVDFYVTFTSFGSYVFDSCESLETVNFANNITVGQGMFRNCTALVSVDFEHVTGMSYYSFQGCSSLEYADLSYITGWTVSQVTNGFQNCTSLKEVVWRTTSGTSTVPANFFTGCSSLSIITNTEKIATINSEAFSGCTSLTDYTAFGNVTSISDRGFQNCGFTSVDLSDVTSLGIQAFEGCENLETVIFPTNMQTTSKNYIFRYCSSLRNVELSSNLETITQGTFYGCSSLLSIDLSCVTTIGESAFEGCSSLVSVKFAEGLTKIESSTFRDCAGLMSVTFPDSLASIGQYAFYGCTSLESLIIPSNVTSVGYYSFQGCEGLVDLEYSPTCGDVVNYAFYGCKSLEHVVITEGVTRIMNYAFYGCESLEDVVLPTTVTAIYDHAFYGCGFETARITSSILTIDGTCFGGCPNLLRFDVEVGNIAYRTGASGELVKISDNSVVSWPSGYSGVATLETGASIAAYTFMGCSKLTEIDLPNGIDSVPSYAFYGCTSLESIDIPSTVVSIGDYAFACSGLKNIVIPSSVTVIGQYAFAYSALESVTFEGNPETIGNYAFAYCENLTTIVFAGDFDSMGDYMFFECVSLESVDLPASVKTLGTSCFGGCVSLKSVTMKEGLETIGTRAFSGCVSVKSVCIPSSVTSVAANVFTDWTEEQTIYIALTAEDVAESWTEGWDADCEADVVYGYTG